MGEAARAPVRVAIVDSGVRTDHPHIAGRGTVELGPTIGLRAEIEHARPAVDVIGHGTAVAAAILDLAPGSHVYAVRVFEDAFDCLFESVLVALRVALDWRPQLVNLSLGTSSPQFCAQLERMIALAAARGARIVAPASAHGLPSYPGSLAGVEAVVVDPNCTRRAPGRREIHGRTYWFASPLPRAIEDVPVAANWSGVSFAVANVTGCLAGARDR